MSFVSTQTAHVLTPITQPEAWLPLAQAPETQVQTSRAALCPPLLQQRLILGEYSMILSQARSRVLSCPPSSLSTAGQWWLCTANSTETVPGASTQRSESLSVCANAL